MTVVDTAMVRDASKRILVISNSFPEDLTRQVTGAHQRLGVFVEALKELGKLDFLFFVERRLDVTADSVARYRDVLAEHYGADLELELVPREPPPAVNSRWDLYGAPMLDGFRNWQFRLAAGTLHRAALEAALQRKPDVVFVHRLTAMAPVLKTNVELPPVCFDLDDIEHLAFVRQIPDPPSWRGKRLFYLQTPALWWIERKAAALARKTFVCSETDRAYLSRSMRTGEFRIIPNSVTIPEPRPLPEMPTALFLGNLGYPPNRNAAMRLVEDIWPLVREIVPEARLTIAGPHPEGVPAHADPGPGIKFTGFVENLGELYAGARVVCAPIEAGGGTRLKIIEAAAHGRPVVSTPFGADGLDLVPGREIVIEEAPREFARAVAELLVNAEEARRIGRAGHEAVRRTYDRARVVALIRREVGDLL